MKRFIVIPVQEEAAPDQRQQPKQVEIRADDIETLAHAQELRDAVQDLLVTNSNRSFGKIRKIRALLKKESV